MEYTVNSWKITLKQKKDIPNLVHKHAQDLWKTIRILDAQFLKPHKTRMLEHLKYNNS